jgi:hypothetical protein
MTFRTGAFRGRGNVYSRRRGRGTGPVNNTLRNKANIIYEEPEEESDINSPSKNTLLEFQSTNPSIAAGTIP